MRKIIIVLLCIVLTTVKVRAHNPAVAFYKITYSHASWGIEVEFAYDYIYKALEKEYPYLKNKNTTIIAYENCMIQYLKNIALLQPIIKINFGKGLIKMSPHTTVAILQLPAMPKKVKQVNVTTDCLLEIFPNQMNYVSFTHKGKEYADVLTGSVKTFKISI